MDEHDVDSQEMREWSRSLATRTHERTSEELHRANEAARQSALSVLRALLLLNGGSAIALLTFVGSLATSSNNALDPLALTLPLRWFAYGAGAAVVATALAYLTSYALVGAIAKQVYAWDHPYVKDSRASVRWHWAANALHILTILVALFALILFFVGVSTMIAAVSP